MNMDSDVKRHEREPYELRYAWASRPKKNPYRPRALKEGRLLLNLTTPHHAGTLPVCSGIENWVISPTDPHLNWHSSAESQLASQRQSLSSVAQVW